MEEKKFLFSDANEQASRINRFITLGNAIYNVLIFVIVLISALRGFRTIAYTLVLGGIMLAGVVVTVIINIKDKHSKLTKYVVLISMSIVTAMVSYSFNSYYMRFLTGSAFIACILYFDMKFLLLSLHGVMERSV